MRAATIVGLAVSTGCALFAGSIPQAHSQNRDMRDVAVPVTDCDQYAANPFDPDRKAPGIAFEKIDAGLAIPACEAAVRQYPNSPRLMFQLGRAYSKNRDFSFALVQYRKAADLGYAPARSAMGIAYQNGEGVQKDSVVAFNWYSKAAEQGYVPAQVIIGIRYQNGDGVTKDQAKATAWLRKAAEQGSALAENILGYTYQKGAEKDFPQAVIWYRKAAEQGDAAGQFNLGTMYLTGQGIAKDEKLAAYWFRKAAEQNFAEAQFGLGILYQNGVGVPQDYNEATRWFRKSAEQGNKDAKEKLAKLNARISLGKALTSVDCTASGADIKIRGCTSVINDPDESQQNRASAFYNRGVAYQDKGDYDHAIVDYNEAIRLDPNNAVAFYNRGIAYRAMGDTQRAIADFTHAIGLDPSNSDAYKERASTYQYMGDIEHARADRGAATIAATKRQQDSEAQQASTDLDRGYRHITFEDFQLDGKKLAASEEKVAIQGVYVKLGEIEELFPSAMALMLAQRTLGSDDGIALLTDDAARNVRKYFLKCRDNVALAQLGCPLTVLGHAAMCTRTSLVGATNVPCLVVEDGR